MRRSGLDVDVLDGPPLRLARSAVACPLLPRRVRTQELLRPLELIDPDDQRDCVRLLDGPVHAAEPQSVLPPAPLVLAEGANSLGVVRHSLADETGMHALLGRGRG